MEDNDNLEVKDLKRKMEVLFNYEKELIKEDKRQSHRTDIIEDEINNIKKRIESLERQVSLLEKKSSPELINHRTLTPIEIAELKEKLSWSQLSKYLKCSISTCQRLVRKGKEQMRDGR